MPGPRQSRPIAEVPSLGIVVSEWFSRSDFWPSPMIGLRNPKIMHIRTQPSQLLTRGNHSCEMHKNEPGTGPKTTRRRWAFWSMSPIQLVLLFALPSLLFWILPLFFAYAFMAGVEPEHSPPGSAIPVPDGWTSRDGGAWGGSRGAYAKGLVLSTPAHQRRVDTNATYQEFLPSAGWTADPDRPDTFCRGTVFKKCLVSPSTGSRNGYTDEGPRQSPRDNELLVSISFEDLDAVRFRAKVILFVAGSILVLGPGLVAARHNGSGTRPQGG